MDRSGAQPRRHPGPLRWLRRIVVVLLLLFLLPAAGVTFHALWLFYGAPPPAPVSVIVVLGGGVRQDGTPGPDTLERINHAIDLYRAGVAPRMHFTGGHGNPNLPGLGSGMADVAVAAGVPREMITVENVSRSTLQNALLSRATLPPESAGAILVVSDGYHLDRAWALFRWAGYHPVTISASSAFGSGPFRAKARRVARESLAWSYNASRIAAWIALDALGFDRAATDDLLTGLAPEPSALPS